MEEGDILQERYSLERILGRGATATTWLAKDNTNGAEVVVKLLDIAAIGEWKGLELFEREAALLKTLHIPHVPRYIDSFSIQSPPGGDRKAGRKEGEHGGLTGCALVQEYEPGETLEQKVQSGWRGTEAEISAIAVGLLRIIDAIHDLRPPVIHRDINPRNVIVNADGEVSLVDFGGVQDAIRLSRSSGATVIGTPGFMPMEQFVGKATVRSDLYAAAATLLYLLTHENPQDLPTRDMKIDFASVIESSPGVSAVLDSWLEPDEKKRTLSVSRAIDCLEGRYQAPVRDAVELSLFAEENPDRTTPEEVPIAKPHGSKVQVLEEKDRTAILIPERGGLAGTAAMGGFSIFWLGFVAFWTSAAIAMRAPLIFPLFSIPFWLVGLGLLRGVLFSLLGKTRVTITRDGRFFYSKKMIFMGSRVAMPVEELGRCRIEQAPSMKGGMRRTTLLMEAGVKTLRFGETLSKREKLWLEKVINESLEKTRENR
jgi:serine/threonine protein kinase